jgi:hypothetical protein
MIDKIKLPEEIIEQNIMKKEEIIELIEDLQKALSKALNSEVIREYDHLKVRAEIAVKKLTI